MKPEAQALKGHLDGVLLATLADGPRHADAATEAPREGRGGRRRGGGGARLRLGWGPGAGLGGGGARVLGGGGVPSPVGRALGLPRLAVIAVLVLAAAGGRSYRRTRLAAAAGVGLVGLD